MPLAWKAHKRAQKDVDPKWTKKHGKSHFGYKLHASIDKRHKLAAYRLILTLGYAIQNAGRPRSFKYTSRCKL